MADDVELSEEDAAFADGVAEVRGETANEVTEAPKEQESRGATEESKAEAQENAGAEPPEGQPEEQRPEPTLEDRLKAIESILPSVKHGLDSLAGRIGGINRDIQTLKTIRAEQPRDTAAAATQQKIVVEKLKRLSADYPELAAALAEDLNEVLSVPATQPAVPNLDDIERKAEEMATVVVERRLLAKEHPNWEADLALKDELGRPLRDQSGRYIPSPMLLEWLGSKPVEFQEQFKTAVDAGFLSQAISEFKSFRDGRMGKVAQSAPKQSEPAQAASAPASKHVRLAAAMTPRGIAPQSSPASVSDDDAFAAGFRAVRGR